MSGLIKLRCPDCGALLFKSSPRNRFSVEVKCRKCKKVVPFKDLRPPPRSPPLDRESLVL